MINLDIRNKHSFILNKNPV